MMKNPIGDYMSILSWKKVDLCKFTNDVNSFPIIKDYLIRANQSYHGIIHKCPYESFNVNLTVSFYDAFNLTNVFVPNGELRMRVHIFNNRDRNIGTLQISWIRNVVVVF